MCTATKLNKSDYELNLVVNYNTQYNITIDALGGRTVKSFRLLRKHLTLVDYRSKNVL